MSPPIASICQSAPPLVSYKGDLRIPVSPSCCSSGSVCALTDLISFARVLFDRPCSTPAVPLCFQLSSSSVPVLSSSYSPAIPCFHGPAHVDAAS
eukprot:283089-Hanusia_phi.AAC.1